LRGQVAARENSGQLRGRFAKLKPQDLIEAWLSHLFLNCLEPAEELRLTTLVCRDRAVTFPPVGDCRALLAMLLDYYWQGLQYPLPFFPAASREYYDRLRRGATEEAALEQAGSIWAGDEFKMGESSDPYHQLCYRGLDPFSGGFALVSSEFWGPLLEACHGR